MSDYDYNWRATWTNDQLIRTRDSYLYQLTQSLRRAEEQLEELLAVQREMSRRTKSRTVHAPSPSDRHK